MVWLISRMASSPRLADLEDGIIATPLEPDITFSDDPLRMMRCIRFATQLNFQIEDETFVALERMADRIKIVSGERIKDELNKIILSPVPSKGFVDLQRCGLLNIILPELAALDIVEIIFGCVGLPFSTMWAKPSRNVGIPLLAGPSTIIIY